MKTILYLFLLVVLLVGCSVSEQALQTAVAALPTVTPYPSLTPYPTQTPYPSHTAPPTFTPQFTQSPYPTYTPWVVTVTYTATPKFTSTDTATPTDTPTPSNTPNRTQTQQAVINATKGADATATRAARNARATEIAKYEKIDYKELVSYATSHTGELVWIEGRIFNIVNISELQMYLGWTYDAVYVQMRERFSGIYEDTWIKVYGRIDGEHCFKNAYGNTVCQPLLVDAFYELK